MKYNSNAEKCRLRRQQLTNNQSKSKFYGRKSLIKQSIVKNDKSLATDNLNKEIERISLKVEIDDMIKQIVYHIRFYVETRPATYDENKIKDWLVNMNNLESQFYTKQIDAKQYLKHLEDIDKEVMDIINNWQQCI